MQNERLWLRKSSQHAIDAFNDKINKKNDKKNENLKIHERSKNTFKNVINKKNDKSGKFTKDAIHLKML